MTSSLFNINLHIRIGTGMPFANLSPRRFRYLLGVLGSHSQTPPGTKGKAITCSSYARAVVSEAGTASLATDEYDMT